MYINVSFIYMAAHTQCINNFVVCGWKITQKISIYSLVGYVILSYEIKKKKKTSSWPQVMLSTVTSRQNTQQCI